MLKTYLTEKERALIEVAYRRSKFHAILLSELARGLEDAEGFHGPHAAELELLRFQPTLHSLENKGLVRLLHKEVLLTESGLQVCETLFGIVEDPPA
ncbi:MAG: hypothetical protein QF415_08020 [Candidatus Undinarchaeales archaeon]|nr:hypothetical protein [Candidatus Undinarchaeales archaeon]MDP7492983.1 hypothetical protein [Candidatus Undinarchaeales archaeon]